MESPALFAEILDDYRQKVGLNQRQLARRIGVAASSLNGYLRPGEDERYQVPSPTTCDRIAELTGRNPDELRTRRIAVMAAMDGVDLSALVDKPVLDEQGRRVLRMMSAGRYVDAARYLLGLEAKRAA